MRTIAKSAEPASLTAHRKAQHSDYGNLGAGAKNELRISLVGEQRGLCCYCMSRIRPCRQSMKIEHWRSQEHHRSEQLNYRNLLGACLGEEGQPASAQHCDTRKGDKALKWNPANSAHRIERRIRFDLDGTIRAEDPEFHRQLEEILGLNVAKLRYNRRAVVRGIEDWWQHTKQVRDRSRRDRLVLRQRSRYINGDGDLPEYCQVGVHWLDKKRSKAAS